MLVEYAGKDPTEDSFGFYDAKTRAQRQYTRPERAYDLFLLGFDTFDLSKRYGCKEATVLRWITMGRCRRLDRPSPYGVRS